MVAGHDIKGNRFMVIKVDIDFTVFISIFNMAPVWYRGARIGPWIVEGFAGAKGGGFFQVKRRPTFFGPIHSPRTTEEKRFLHACRSYGRIRSVWCFCGLALFSLFHKRLFRMPLFVVFLRIPFLRFSEWPYSSFFDRVEVDYLFYCALIT